MLFLYRMVIVLLSDTFLDKNAINFLYISFYMYIFVK